MRKVNRETLEHVQRWEGLRLEAYPDPGSRDGTPWTIGYGHTAGVRKGMKITAAEAERFLIADLSVAEAAVDRLVHVPITDNQFGALVSFTFNIGATAFSKSTLLKKLNAGHYEAVPAELARWNKNDGKVMQGLVNRRAAEAGLWAKGAFVDSRGVTATPAPPAALTPESIGTGAAGVGALLSPFAASPAVQIAVALLVVGGLGLAVWVFLKKRMLPS